MSKLLRVTSAHRILLLWSIKIHSLPFRRQVSPPLRPALPLSSSPVLRLASLTAFFNVISCNLFNFKLLTHMSKTSSDKLRSVTIASIESSPPFERSVGAMLSNAGANTTRKDWRDERKFSGVMLDASVKVEARESDVPTDATVDGSREVSIDDPEGDGEGRSTSGDELLLVIFLLGSFLLVLVTGNLRTLLASSCECSKCSFVTRQRPVCRCRWARMNIPHCLLSLLRSGSDRVQAR